MRYIVIYSLGKTSPKKRLNFDRELYGFKDYSNNGSYIYHRKGILSKNDYEKLGRGVLLVKKKFPFINKYLKKHNSNYKVFKIR